MPTPNPPIWRATISAMNQILPFFIAEEEVLESAAVVGVDLLAGDAPLAEERVVEVLVLAAVGDDVVVHAATVAAISDPSDAVPQMKSRLFIVSPLSHHQSSGAQLTPRPISVLRCAAMRALNPAKSRFAGAVHSTSASAQERGHIFQSRS